MHSKGTKTNTSFNFSIYHSNPPNRDTNKCTIIMYNDKTNLELDNIALLVCVSSDSGLQGAKEEGYCICFVILARCKKMSLIL